MKNLHTLTALLTILPTLQPRLDGTTPPDKKEEGKPEKKDELRLTPEEWAARERERLSKLGADKVIDDLVKVKAENYELRRKAAPDGGIVLDAEQRKQWDAYVKLGKAEDLTKAVEQGKKDREFVEKAEKADALSKVATAAGWDPETFATLSDMTPGLEWRVQEVKKGEEKIQQAQVKVGDEWKDADAYAEEKWKKFLPVLQQDPDQRTEQRETDSGSTPPATRVPVGGAGGGKGKTYTVEDAEKRLEDSGHYRM